jgi:selenocysteine-specific elongation factor
VIPISSATGQGLEAFTDALDEIAGQVKPRSNSGLFRLPVDRVFTMKGFGTVITGTLISGTVNSGDQIMVYPTGITSKVRGVQVHGHLVQAAQAGMRTAINFQGLDKTAVNRGEIVSTPDSLVPSHMVDVTLHYLPGNKKRFKNRTRVRFHSGTSEIMGIVVLLEGDTLEPGSTTLAQIRLEAPVSLIKDDRYVLRSYSPVRAIGGGRIIHPIAPKHKPGRPEVIDYLRAISGDDTTVLLQRHIEATGHVGCTRKHLKLMMNQPDKLLDQALQTMMSQQIVFQADKETQTYVHRKAVDHLRQIVLDCIGAYHQNFPLKPGMPKEELKTTMPHGIGAKTFLLVLQHMSRSNEVAIEEDTVRLAAHKVSLAADQETLRKKILDAYDTGGFSPPYFKAICQGLDVEPHQAAQVLALLTEEGVVVKVKEDLYYHHRHIEDLRKKLVDFLMSNEEITTPQFKDMTGASRKFVIPLIEYFDRTQLTIRIGDIRKLRKKPGA